MKAYHQLLEEIQGSTFGNPKSLRNQLLGPSTLAQTDELLLRLPLKRHYVGPRAWFNLIEKLNGHGRQA